MDKAKIYLGVDGGASKTDAVIIDENNNELGRGLAAGSNADVFGLSESLDRVSAAIEQACSGQQLNITQSCLAIAGIDTTSTKKVWQHAVKNHLNINQYISKNPLITNDSEAALRAGTTDKDAVVIISGTGSNCFGKNSTGQSAKSGGVGYILSDEGSGYDIGIKILTSVTKSIDGRGNKTILKDLLFKKINVKKFETLISEVYEKPWNKADIGRISPLVDVAATKGDKIAKEIIFGAAHNLSEMIKAVTAKLNLKNKPYSIVIAGSVFNIGEAILNTLKKEVITFSPKAKFVVPSVDSATGAAYLAKERV